MLIIFTTVPRALESGPKPEGIAFASTHEIRPTHARSASARTHTHTQFAGQFETINNNLHPLYKIIFRFVRSDGPLPPLSPRFAPHELHECDSYKWLIYTQRAAKPQRRRRQHRIGRPDRPRLDQAGLHQQRYAADTATHLNFLHAQ